MTPAEFVTAIRTLHTPYLPTIVSVLHEDPTHPDYHGGQWHDATVDEQAASLDWWCDGCNWLASGCRVAHLLVMVES